MWAWLFMLLLCLGAADRVRADEARGKELFEQGVAKAAEERWEEAVALFEASLQQSEKPATRYNLLLANHALGRPLETARHALEFLAVAKAESHSDARVHAEQLLAEAERALVILSTLNLPADVQVQVDGAPPALVWQRHVYVLPGAHHLEARIDADRVETIELTLGAGQRMPWPRVGRSIPAAATSLAIGPKPLAVTATQPRRADDPDLFRLRRRTAWVLGGTGAALAAAGLGCQIATLTLGTEIEDGGAERVGYPSDAVRYDNLRQTVIPLALSGGVLMAGAVLMGARLTRRGNVAWAVTSLALGAALLGTGTAFMVRTPEALVEDTPLERPSRQTGSLLVASALPLLTYGMGHLLVRRSTRLQHVALALGSGVRW